MRPHRHPRRFAALIFSIAFGLIAFGLVLSCIPEKPPRAPPTPTTRPAPELSLRDLAGRERSVRRGITPGALEAEGPAPPPRKKAEQANDKS